MPHTGRHVDSLARGRDSRARARDNRLARLSGARAEHDGFCHRFAPWKMVPTALGRGVVPGRVRGANGATVVRAGGWYGTRDQRSRQPENDGARGRVLSERGGKKGGGGGG